MKVMVIEKKLVKKETYSDYESYETVNLSFNDVKQVMDIEDESELCRLRRAVDIFNEKHKNKLISLEVVKVLDTSDIEELLKDYKEYERKETIRKAEAIKKANEQRAKKLEEKAVKAFERKVKSMAKELNLSREEVISLINAKKTK